MIALYHQAVTWAQTNPDTLKVGLSALSFIGGIIFFLWKRIVAGVTHVRNRYINRLQVCTISSTSAKRLDDFIELYHQSFPSSERISTTEIYDWLQYKANDVRIQYRLYLSLHGSEPVGIAISFYDKRTNILYIPYLAVSQLDVQWKATRAIIRELVRAVSRQARQWEIAYVEVADPAEAGLTADDTRRRSARVRRLKTLVAGEGFQMRRLDFVYQEPAFVNDDDQSGNRSMLLYVILKRRDTVQLSRDQTLAALELLYVRIYCASYCGTSEACRSYEQELRDQLLALGETLPENISLVE